MDTFILFLSLYTSVLTGVMMYLLGKKKRSGWAVSMVNQFNWTLLAVVTHAYGLLPLAAIMTFLAIHGWRNWSTPAFANGTRQDKLARIGVIVHKAKAVHHVNCKYIYVIRDIEEVLHGDLDS